MTYVVAVERRTVEVATFEVRAGHEDEAEEKAMKLAEEEQDTWEYEDREFEATECCES